MRTMLHKSTHAYASPESPALNPVLADLIAQNALGRIQQLRRAGAIASRSLERILDQIFLVLLDRSREGLPRNCSAGRRCLKARRQMMAMYDLAVTYQHGPLN